MHRQLRNLFLLIILSSTPTLHAAEWPLSQFPTQDPILTFETGSTLLPSINGLTLTGGDSTFENTNYNPNNICIGKQYFGNLDQGGVGLTYLDITFKQPQQAIGAYIINADNNNKVTGVMEVIYDQSNNVLESESQAYPGSAKPPVFLGIGLTNTNIYKVEWRYTGPAGFFGVDNVTYQPGPPQQILSNSQVSAISNSISLTFQTLPGHTNTLQTQTNLGSGNWTYLTNYLGLGETRTITIPTTNAASFFRIQIQ